MRLCTLLLLFSLQNGLHSLIAPLPIYENYFSDLRHMRKWFVGLFSSSNTDQTIPSSSSPSPSDEKPSILEKENTVQEEHSELDLHATHQSIPSPTSANIETSSLPDRPQETSNGTMGVELEIAESDSNALLSTTSPEHLEPAQVSILEKEKEQKEQEELHEEQSEMLTTPIPTTPSPPRVDPIYNSSKICHSQSTCYVYPENCLLNCDVIFAWKSGESKIYVRQMFTYGVISIKSTIESDKYDYRLFSCFEHAGFCAYGSVDGYGRLSYRIREPITPSGGEPMPENSYLMAFNSPHPVVPFGKGRKMEFRLDADRDVGGEFQKLFLKSKE
ncbi:Protein CBG07466 [Caenorhabditis briggsae]|uniref:Protein CBG07466 n=2 Tax=Caenorhabditis briggsae TaxID=6238 RepID=A8X4Q5_CAEBR|nr:Protein CBG07466 [Caenorhabditis briggsae]ULT84758.1 hypothetical protein L3Y34_013436 [Caenorhabditis briggsae]CAP27615.1 Protein CBG07466 [Caenorhabditis briggsae]